MAEMMQQTPEWPKPRDNQMEQMTQKIHVLVHWLCLLVTVQLAMIAYDTDTVYHINQLIHSL